MGQIAADCWAGSRRTPAVRINVANIPRLSAPPFLHRLLQKHPTSFIGLAHSNEVGCFWRSLCRKGGADKRGIFATFIRTAGVRRDPAQQSAAICPIQYCVRRLCVRRDRGGQGELKSCTPAGSAGGPQAAAMRLNDGTTDGQPHTSPVVLGRKE